MERVTKPILVVGATGRHGATGAFVARELVRRGIPVRALVRQDDERSRALVLQGIPVAIGDLNDGRTLGPALQGITTAFFTYPIAKGAVNAATQFASAGRNAGLERIVVMSMAIARADSPSPLGRAQWLAEQIFEWAGFDTVNLRIAALFVENLELLHASCIAGDGVIRNSFEDVSFSWITGEDAAKLAVATLLYPERAGGVRDLYPSGGDPASHADAADALSAALGRPIRHETISQQEWTERLIAQGQVDPRINPDMAEHISAVGAALRNPPTPNGLFEILTREKPKSLLDLIRSGAIGTPHNL